MDGRRTDGSRATAAMSAAAVGWIGLAGAIALVACNAILGIDEAVLQPAGSGGQGGQGGEPPSCANANECDDSNPCTIDSCEGTPRECVRSNVANGPAPAELQAPGDCRTVVCSQGNVISQADDADLPVDDNECTDDLCASGAPSNPARTNGATCAQDGGVVCYTGDCVECYVNAHCEVPDTCGGAGTPFQCGCAPDACDALSCGWGQDAKCQTGSIDCNDHQTNGDETDVDCGGPGVVGGGTCDTRCADGRHCTVPSDCVSGLCSCEKCGPDGCDGGVGGAGGG